MVFSAREYTCAHMRINVMISTGSLEDVSMIRLQLVYSPPLKGAVDIHLFQCSMSTYMSVYGQSLSFLLRAFDLGL